MGKLTCAMQRWATGRGTAKFWGPLSRLSSDPAPLTSWVLELPIPLPDVGDIPGWSYSLRHLAQALETNCNVSQR